MCLYVFVFKLLLQDNFNAVVDVVGSSDRDLLSQVSYFYGVKFGDGRYEVKSADGQGDKEKFMKEVRFATSGKLQELLVARVTHAASGESTANALEVVEAANWEDVVSLFAKISRAQIDEINKKYDNVREVCKKLAGDDSKLERLFYAILGADFWQTRLSEAITPNLNKKLLMRVMACNSPMQRSELAKKVDLGKALTASDDETNFLKAVWGL